MEVNLGTAELSGSGRRYEHGCADHRRRYGGRVVRLSVALGRCALCTGGSGTICSDITKNTTAKITSTGLSMTS